MPPVTKTGPTYTSHLSTSLQALESDDQITVAEFTPVLREAVRARPGEKQGVVTAAEAKDILAFARDRFSALDTGTQRAALRALAGHQVDDISDRLPFARDGGFTVDSFGRKQGRWAIDGRMPNEGAKPEVAVVSGTFEDDQRVGVWTFQGLKGSYNKYYEAGKEVPFLEYASKNMKDPEVQKDLAQMLFTNIAEDTGLFVNFDRKKHVPLVQWNNLTSKDGQVAIRLMDKATGRTSDVLVGGFYEGGLGGSYFANEGKEGPRVGNGTATSHNGDDRSGD